jgi:probable HAF family extracellular repeat protein
MSASRDGHGAFPNRGSHWCLLAKRPQGRPAGAGAAIGAAAASGRRKAQIAAVTAVMIVAAASFSAGPAAAEQSASPADGLRYRLIDLGTLGGPNSAETQEFPFINTTGMVAGFADTATPNPGNPEGFVFHAFRWRGGPLRDLGALPGGVNSFAIWSNDAGTVAGLSENGKIDPLLGVPEGRGVLWKKSGQIVNLGTFGGHESLAGYINDRGQIVGVAANRKRDPFSLFGWGTQTRAFLWQQGVMRDLGTLGGPDANAVIVNNHGQVAGASYTNSAPNPDTGSPTLHPFLWAHGTMADLGTLGGTVGFATALNNRGQVAGLSSTAGNQGAHPFLWDRGKLTDLGTLGGTFGIATWMNNAGEVAGGATTRADKAFHAFFWRGGTMTDLGTITGDTCSVAHFMNSRGQVVGTSGGRGCDQGQSEKHGFISERGGPMIDLNGFVPEGSHLTVTDGETINDRGEIAASGLLPNGDFHAVVLIPCTGGQGCQDGSRHEGTRQSTPATSSPTAAGAPLAWTPNEMATQLYPRNRLPLAGGIGRSR